MARLDEYLTAYDAQAAFLLDWLPQLRQLPQLPGELAARPTRLGDWSVADLVFHTTEVPNALVTAVAAPRPRDKPLSIAAYTTKWRDSAPEIAARAAAGSAGLTLEAMASRHADGIIALHAAVEAAGDVAVQARRGPMKLTDFLLTRVDELVVHSLDLSAAVPELPPVELDRKALGIACRMLTGILAELAPGHTVEVRVPPYSAVQCVAGPRHTRGTPPNVVELEPVTWVELATGRLDWAEAIRGGQVRASGERSDISALLPVLS